MDIKRYLAFALLLLIALMATGCVFDVPEGARRQHHSYEEALAYARALDPQATVGADFRDSVNEYGHRYREWPAVINGLDCYVCSRHHTVYDSTGEFARIYYTMTNDHDYRLMSQLLQGSYEDWRLLEGLNGQYHNSGNVYVFLPAPPDQPLDDASLRTLWEATKALQETYALRAIAWEAHFALPVPATYTDLKQNVQIRMGNLYFSDFSETSWATFLAQYHERWQLLLPQE